MPCPPPLDFLRKNIKRCQMTDICQIRLMVFVRHAPFFYFLLTIRPLEVTVFTIENCVFHRQSYNFEGS